MLPPLRHQDSKSHAPERVVILGARGFVGTALSNELERRRIPTLKLSSSDIDLSSPQGGQTLAAHLRSSDSVVFLSALKSGRALDQAASDANLAMGTAVFDAIKASSCQHLIYLSSDSVYPFQDSAIAEATPAAATTLYSGMHLAREAMLRRLDVPFAVLRATQVYGYGDTHNAYGPNRMIRSALLEKCIVLFGGGEDTRDHVYIGDLVTVLVEVLLRRSWGLLNVAAGESRSFADIAQIIGRSCPHDVPIHHAERKIPIFHRHFDVTHFRQQFPDLTATSLSEGISLLLDAYKRRDSTVGEAAASGM